MRRYKLEQADWHITLRGARRLLLFHDNEDYQSFYGMLGYACERSGMGHIANCLMSNHFHLSLSGSSDQLSNCMWKLDRQYSGYHNDKYGLSGHAFEQEYYREPIRSQFILQRVVRYIHLNPVRAGLARTPEEYPWSSFSRLMRSATETLGADERRLLSTFSSDLLGARATYSTFLEKALQRKPIQRKAKNSAWELWQEQFSWFLEFAQESAERIYPLQPEDIAAWWAVKSGVPPRAIAKVLGHPDGRQVSRMCYRLSQRMDREPALAARIYALGVL